MLRRELAVAIVVFTACGGAAQQAEPAATGPDPARSAQLDVMREPIEIELAAARVGGSLRLDVQGVGRGVSEGEPFEDPDRWRIEASAGGSSLDRLVNGPVRIERSPVGGAYSDQWDTTIRFSVVFEMPPEESKVEVLVIAPKERPWRRTLDIIDNKPDDTDSGDGKPGKGKRDKSKRDRGKRDKSKRDRG